ncbi:MAG: FHA domain-containing protein [Isosphaeraceae bacterium]
MNYALHVVKGRSGVNTLRLVDGVNSIGRHDDCLIRIRSSQVSRRHCEVLMEGDALVVRDLGSSNGTFVNGKRVLGKQTLNSGDVLTIGGVTLRVDQLQGAAAASPKPAPHDTAELDAIPVGEEDLELELAEEEEFEITMEDKPAPEHIDIIPLEDEPAAAPPMTTVKRPTATSKPGESGAKAEDETPKLAEEAIKAKPTAEEEDAVAQFLMDLKLDEDD